MPKYQMESESPVTEQPGLPPLTTGQKISDAVTALVGSWRFIIIQSCVLATWIVLNVTGIVSFDPYPFILLNLCLSFQAAYTAPFIMMSQNRQSMKDRQTIEKDLELNFTELDLNLKEVESFNELRAMLSAWQEQQDVSRVHQELAALHEKFDLVLAKNATPVATHRNHDLR